MCLYSCFWYFLNLGKEQKAQGLALNVEDLTSVALLLRSREIRSYGRCRLKSHGHATLKTKEQTNLKKKSLGLEMAQQLGIFAADAGQSGLGSSTHTAQSTNAGNSSSKGSDALHWPSQAPAHIHRNKHTHTYKNKIEKHIGP